VWCAGCRAEGSRFREGGYVGLVGVELVDDEIVELALQRLHLADRLREPLPPLESVRES